MNRFFWNFCIQYMQNQCEHKEIVDPAVTNGETNFPDVFMVDGFWRA